MERKRKTSSPNLEERRKKILLALYKSLRYSIFIISERGSACVFSRKYGAIRTNQNRVYTVPLPGVDLSADITIMVELLSQINKRFGLSEEQLNQLDMERKKVLLVIISSVGNELAGRTVSATVVRSLLKRAGNRIAAKQLSRFVPIAGQALSAGISFAAMRYLGRNHVEQCYQIALRYMRQIDRRFTGDVIDI